MAKIFEFKPSTDGSDLKKEKTSPEKGKIIPIGMSRLEHMGDKETNEIIRKFEAFMDLKIQFNREICNRYKKELEEYSLDDLLLISLNLTDQDMQMKPAYTIALFEITSQKLKTRNK